MDQESSIEDIYDAIYQRLLCTTLFQEILGEVLGADFLEVGGQFSFVKHGEIDEIVMTVQRLAPSLRGLDVGCGLGGLTIELARRCGGAWVGIDISRVAVEAAQQRGEPRGESRAPAFVLGSVQAMPFPAREFDCIVAIDSLQHAVPYSTCARELRRVLKIGGLLVFTNWMRNLPLNRLATEDPLLSALVENGFEIRSTKDTDPGLNKQLGVYVALYQRRREVEREIGRDFLEMMFREAGHLVPIRNSVCRSMTVAALLRA
jgi:SAM-dependent methyltransferase